jgi:hypothetical protein
VNVFTGLGLGGKHLKCFYLIGWGKCYFSIETLDVLIFLQVLVVCTKR